MREIDRRIARVERLLPPTAAHVHPIDAALRAAGIDLNLIDNDALDRLERLASTWPPALGNIPIGIVRAAAGTTDWSEK